MKKSAFPIIKPRPGTVIEYGISKRLYIATKIVAGLMSNIEVYQHDSDKDIVQYSFDLADKLIKQDEIEKL